MGGPKQGNCNFPLLAFIPFDNVTTRFEHAYSVLLLPVGTFAKAVPSRVDFTFACDH